MSEFSESIKDLRSARGLSTGDAAGALGCAKGTFRKWESGSSTPKGGPTRQRQILSGLGKARAGYDATKPVRRRAVPKSVTKNEDDELNRTERRRLTATTQDLRRNFSAVGWHVRKHLDYVSTFTFQSRNRTIDPKNKALLELDKQIEGFIEWWSLAENCDIAGRHSFQRFRRLSEEHRTIDGDMVAHRLASGHLQGISGDRIYSELTTYEDRKVTNGVQVNKFDKALKYSIASHTKSGQLRHQGWVRAGMTFPLAYFDSFNQIRGISPIAGSVNTFRDAYENLDYARAKAKVSQLLGLVTYRDPSICTPLTEVGTKGEDAEGNARYNINMGAGTWHLDLDAGDKAEILESGTPSTQFQDYMQLSLALAIKGLDIPYSFFDESFTNYSGARQGWLLYEQSAKIKRQDLIAWQNAIYIWKIAGAILDGRIVLPAGMEIQDLRWEWVATGVPWIDPLKEINAEIAALNAKLTSRTRISKKFGTDWQDILSELTVEEREIADAGLVSQSTYAPVPAEPPEDDNRKKGEKK